MANNYWAKVLAGRASRRTIVAGGAGLAGAAALLAACGGDSDSNGDAASGSAKVFKDDKAEGPVKTGGIYKKQISADPANMDLYRQTAAGPKDQFGGYSMSRVVNFKIGPGIRGFQVQGDLADSWEVSDG